MPQPINNKPEENKDQETTQNNKQEQTLANEIKNGLPDQQEGSMNNGVLGANFEEKAKELNDADKKS